MAIELASAQTIIDACGEPRSLATPDSVLPLALLPNEIAA
jgi:hypothetical protein